MIIIGAALFGAIIGGMTAARRQGNKLDIAQYAAGYAIGFAIIGLFITLFVHRASL
ncbi:MAG: apolipoprotein acyltransferase [Rhodobacterales bacterium 34-62-10]|nr:MAG: apolipoprotein acyltransferase [Rhodobacterales bacterium 34-62-10]